MMVNLLPVAGQYNPVWWTIPVESTFYLILPFAVYLFSGKRLLLGLLLTGVISLGWNLLCFNPPALLLEPLLWFHRACLEGVVPLAVIRNSSRGVLITQLPTYAFVFGLGIFLANLQVRKQLGLAQGRFWKSVVSARFGATYFVTGWAISIVAMDLYGNHILKGEFVNVLSVSAWSSLGFSLIIAGLLFGPNGHGSSLLFSLCVCLGWSAILLSLASSGSLRGQSNSDIYSALAATQVSSNLCPVCSGDLGASLFLLPYGRETVFAGEPQERR